MADAWRGDVQRERQQGRPLDAMKALMLEMRRFSEKPCVLQLGIDTSKFYTDPAGFGLALREAGASEADVGLFALILLERGLIFLALEQPGRALRDLRASLDLGISEGEQKELGPALRSARRALEALEMKDREAEQLRKVPVTILTGFLGSGKTTLLNFVLKARHGYKYAIIENEVGQIGIDNQLLKSANATAAHTTEQVVLLDNGCLCCTVRSDLVEAVKQILLKADAEAANAQAADGTTDEPAQKVLDGILIETTGLADPGPVCKTFYVEPDLRERTRVDCVLTLVDACHFLQQLSRTRSEDAVNESMQQVAFADKILLNKVDAASAASLQEVEATIRSINALCPIVRCSLAKNPTALPLEELFTAQGFSLDRILQRMQEKPDEGSWQLSTPVEASEGRRKRAKTGGFLRASRHDAGVGSCSIALTGAPLVIQRFTEVMSALKNEHALDLYRYKGVVCVKEASGELKQAVLQGVHDMCEFEPRGDWPDGKEPLSQLVFIGRNLEKDKWMRLFTFCQAGVLDDPEDRKGGTKV